MSACKQASKVGHRVKRTENGKGSEASAVWGLPFFLNPRPSSVYFFAPYPTWETVPGLVSCKEDVYVHLLKLLSTTKGITIFLFYTRFSRFVLTK